MVKRGAWEWAGLAELETAAVCCMVILAAVLRMALTAMTPRQRALKRASTEPLVMEQR